MTHILYFLMDSLYMSLTRIRNHVHGLVRLQPGEQYNKRYLLWAPVINTCPSSNRE